MEVRIGSRTDAGKRENNEDSVLVLKPKPDQLNADAIVIVADGMGGRQFGEEASGLAVKTVMETLEGLLKPGGHSPPFEDAVATALRRANSCVYDMAHASGAANGMGTTCVAAIFGKKCVTIGHVGDSRAYLLRDGLLRRLTDDHSYIQDQVKHGQLSDHDARHSRFRHVITKAVGIEATVKPDIGTHALEVGDFVLICTDGLSNIVDEAGMIQIISRAPTPQQAVDFLVDAAKRGGSKDNITGAVVRISDEYDKLADMDEDAELITRGQAMPANGSTELRVAAATKAKPHGDKLAKRPISPLVTAILGLLIGAALMFAADEFIGLSKLKARSTPVHLALEPPFNVSLLTYAPPQNLLSFPVAGTVLAGSDRGVVVADKSTGALSMVTFDGRVTPAGTISPPSSVEANVFAASDPAGDLYVSVTSPPTIKRYGPDGKFQRTVADGQLKSPQAIYVNRQGDIYVIDSGWLKMIKATAATSAAAPAPSPGLSPAGQGSQ